MPFCHQHLALQQPCITIQMQEFNRCLTGWRQADDSCALQDKMVAPVLCSWVEEKNHLPRPWINRAKVCALIAIAFCTGTSEIVATGFAFVPDSNDMVYLMGVRRVVLMQQAIFATTPRSGQNETAESWRDFRAGHWFCSRLCWTCLDRTPCAGFEQDQNMAIL